MGASLVKPEHIGRSPGNSSFLEALPQREHQKMHMLHGGIYLLKLLMLFVERGINQGYSFRLGTEVPQAKKFDDLVFEISTDGKKIYRLLQAKYRENNAKSISFAELLTDSDNDFSLVKYYFAFQDCKKEKFFENGIIKDVTVYTNIDLNFSTTFEWKNEKEIIKEFTLKEVMEEIDEKDEILDVNDKRCSKNVSQCKRYRFKNNIIELLKEKLQSYNLTKIAIKLIKCILASDGIRHHQEPIKSYHVALAEEVIDKNSKRFHEKFIISKGLSKCAKKFREAFIKKLELLSKGRLTLETINEAITFNEIIDGKKIGLILSKQFGVGNYKNWPEDAIAVKDIEEFLGKLVFAVNQPNQEELGELIEKDLGKDFNFAEKSYVYNEFFQHILKWSMGEGESFISNKTGSDMLAKIKTMGASLVKPEHIGRSPGNSSFLEALPQREHQKMHMLHGGIYLLKLLMLFVERGINQGYSFRLGTEVPQAKKFDDLVFEISTDGKKIYRLLQAKYRENNAKSISFAELLTDSDNDFSLVKYYFAFQDCKKEKFFENGIIKDVTVYTNIDLNFSTTFEWKNEKEIIKEFTLKEVMEEIDEKDEILDVNDKRCSKNVSQCKRYRFKNNIIELLKEKLQSYNLTKIAIKLIKCILASDGIRHHQEPIKSYHVALAEEVIDKNSKRFHEKFIISKGLSKCAKKFREAFIKKLELLSKGRLTLETINEAITFNEIIDGKKIGLILSKQFGVGNYKNWPEDAIAVKDIEEFLGKLVFAVNQPNQEELGELIEKDLGKDFNFAEKSYVYNEFFQHILKWSMGEGESFISSKTGSNMLANIKDNLKFITINGELKLKIERSGIKFNQDAIDKIGFKEFLNPGVFEQKILHILAQRNILTTIKVYQVLHDNNLNYIFLPLSSILAYKDHITKTFLYEIDLLIIQCDDIENKTNVQQLFEHIINIMQSDKNKAVVLIAEESIILDNLLTKKDEQNTLIHLTSDSQNEILKKKVSFQGIEVTLNELMIEDNLKHCIDAEMLSKFINREHVAIGKALPGLGDIEVYYIDRVFNRQTKIKSSFQDEKNQFIIIGNDQDLYIPNSEKNKDIVIISDSEEYFENLSYIYHVYNIHWLKQKGDEYMWQQSHGSLDRLRKFFHTQNKKYAPKKIDELDDKVVIIASPPGMGKSTTLTKLAIESKKSNPIQWVLRINLLYHSNTFLEWEENQQFKQQAKEAVKFLIKTNDFLISKKNSDKGAPNIDRFITVNFDDNINFSIGEEDGIKGLALLEIQLFISLYNQCKITILLDGFDEILPIYKSRVINLLKILKNSSKLGRLWITTRPYNIVKELENELSTVSYTLGYFSRQNQIAVLENFWKNTPVDFNDEHSIVFIDELFLINFLPMNNERELLAIPLHAYMIAIVFQDLFEYFHNKNYEAFSREHKKKLSEKLNLSALYEYFIQTKSHEMQNDITNKYNEFIDTHMLLAMYEIFEECWLNNILSEEEKSRKGSLLEKVMNGGKTTGMLIAIVDNKPRFIHRMFAEYFVARYFWEKFLSIKSENLILAFLRTLINDDRTEICEFLHAMVQQNKNSVLSHINYAYILQTCLVLDELIKNTYSRTEYDISKKVNDSTKLLWILIELIFPTGDNDSNDNFESKVNIKHLANTKKLGLLSISAEMGYIRLTNALAKELDPKIIRNDLRNAEWCNTPLWLAASNDHLNILEILMQKFSYDSSWIDRKSKNLFQAIFSETAFDVLSSCLNLNIININSPFQDGDIEQLPILCCIESNAPINLVELLIEKVDVNYLNNYKCFCEHDAVLHMAVGLFKYPKHITDFAIEKRINFNKVINSLLKEIDLLTWKHESLQANSKCTVLSGETYKLFAVIKFMLQCGIIYDCQETLQLAERICYTHKLLHEIYATNNEEQKIVKVDVLNTILKLIIDYRPKYPNSNDFKIHIDADGMFLQYGEAVKINLLPNGLETLLFEYFKNTNTPILRYTIAELHDYVNYKIENIEAYKELFISQAERTSNAILESTYRQCLEYESSSKCTKGLLKRVIELYVQSKKTYEFNEVLQEVRIETIKFSKMITKLLEIEIEKKKSNSEKTSFTIDEVIYILGIENVDTSKELQILTSNVYECGDSQSFVSAWSHLNNLTRTEVPDALKRISTFTKHSLDILESLKNNNNFQKHLAEEA